MKKLFSTLFLIALTTSVFAQYQYFDFSAVCPSGDTLYYTIIDDTTAEVSPPSTNWNGHTQPTGHLIIPEAVEHEGNTYTVISIDQRAFNQCNELTSVELPNTIVSIQEDAFCHTGLTSVEIPNSVTILKAWAFAHCTDLLSLTIGSSVATIETGAFRYCTHLQTIYCNTPALPQYAHAYNNYYYDGEIFENVPNDIPVYVSCLAFDQFATNEQWDQFTDLQSVFVGIPQLDVSCNTPELGTAEVVLIPDNCDDNTAVVRATPNPGHVFSYWKKGIEMVSFSPEYSFALEQNTVLIACFDSSPIVYDSIAYPDHIIGQKLNIFGEVTYEYPSNFIYDQDGILTNFVFPNNVSTRYSFDHFPSRPSSIYSSFVGHPVTTENYSFIYNGDNQITNMDFYHEGDGEEEAHYFYYYDNEKRLIKKEFHNKYGCFQRFFYAYTDGSRTRTDSIVYCDEYSGQVYKSTHITNHFNQRNQPLTILTENYNSTGELTSSTLQTYSYTAHHQTDSVTTQTMNDGGWVNTSVAHYVYDEIDRVIEYQTGSWSTEDNHWNITKKTIYNFNDDEQTLTISFRKKNTEGWEKDVFTDQTLFFDPNLYEWQRACSNYIYQNVNQFTINLHYVKEEASFPRQSEWYYEIEWENGDITYQHLEYASDTTINTTRPKVIVRSNTQYDKDAHTEVTHEYILEEGNKVYWWNKDLEEYTLLYDYTAETGDEWEIKVDTETITVHVDSIGLFEYDGETKKVLHISDAGNIFNGDIVVGYGHMTSFFPEKLMNRNSDYTVDGLRCYWVGDALLYHNGDEDCDAIYSEIHGIEEDGPSTGSGTLTVYPNPANGVIYVETRHGTSLPDLTYRISNLIGQTLLSGTLSVRLPQCDSPTTIDISSLPAGMYFISVGNKTVKFVVK